MVWQEIKNNSQVNQAIKESFRVRSSDQGLNLAIKIFDRRRRWKYGAHSGDYPLESHKVYVYTYSLSLCNLLKS